MVRGMVLKKACACVAVTLVATLFFTRLAWTGPKPQANEVPNAEVSAAFGVGTNALLGTFVGEFGSHRITVCFQNAIGQTINGFSVVAGNERAFSGSVQDKGATGDVVAHEPGDHPQDGTFHFIYQYESKRLTGTWTPNNHAYKKVDFDLKPREFKYDPKSGQYPQASTRLLKTRDVENLRPEELRLMRNEMYARHGYTFLNEQMRNHFEEQDWYMPINFNVVNQLTPLEQHNEALIKKYETYGTEHYDAFGR